MKKNVEKRRNKMKKAVLIGVPHHNNLGDHAIVLAEREYIENNFKENMGKVNGYFFR